MSRAFTEWASGKVSEEALKHGPELWGGKGHGLMQMCADKLPVPPGFTLSTELCAVYLKNPVVALGAIEKSLPAWLETLEKHFGYLPLLSVRSGARVSMPGMMDTVLNVGLTKKNANEWGDRLGPICAADNRKRLEEMFSKVVGSAVPDNVTAQLLACIGAVFKSWNSARAIEYRKLHNIPQEWGTAVTVQAMVFGNSGDSSGTGVAFTRDPSTGTPSVVGEYLQNAQGEDVVAGIKKPGPLTDIRKFVSISAYNNLMALLKKLDAKYRDMQDVEFTIQDGEIYLLQTRSGKRSAAAAFRIANDLVDANTITLPEARARVTFGQFLMAQRPALNVEATEKSLGKSKLQGIPGSIGVAVGRAVFSIAHQTKLAADPQILIRHETTPDDIALMAKAVGIVTATGGFTSHAAVVARGMNIPCVTGCDKLSVVSTGAMFGMQDVQAGDWITVDGATGKVWFGKGVTSADADGASINFVQRLANEEGIRLRASVPASRAYCTAADAPNLTIWATQARHVSDAVLDLRGVSAWVKGKDAEWLANIGVDDTTALAAAVVALCEVKAQPNVQVVLPDVATKPMYTLLEKQGYLPVRAVNVLDDAFQGKGVLRFGPKLAELAGGKAGEQFLREALVAKGAQFFDEDTGVSVIEAARKLLAA